MEPCGSWASSTSQMTTPLPSTVEFLGQNCCWKSTLSLKCPRPKEVGSAIFLQAISGKGWNKGSLAVGIAIPVYGWILVICQGIGDSHWHKRLRGYGIACGKTFMGMGRGCGMCAAVRSVARSGDIIDLSLSSLIFCTQYRCCCEGADVLWECVTQD